MSFDTDKVPNKMMTAPPAKKGWHFPATITYAAAYIEAETIEEATAIYHQVKRLISGSTAATATTPAAATSAPEQSTPAAPIEPPDHEL